MWTNGEVVPIEYKLSWETFCVMVDCRIFQTTFCIKQLGYTIWTAEKILMMQCKIMRSVIKAYMSGAKNYFRIIKIIKINKNKKDIGNVD